MYLVYHWKIVLSLIVACVFYQSYVTSLDVKPQKERYTPNYKVYHNLSVIENTLEHLYQRKSNILHRYEPIYYSRNKRNQHVMKIATNKSGNKNDKARVVLSFGEHAREFLPVETLLYLIENIEFSKIDLSKVDIYVIGLANPDGRAYVEETRNYCWRGTETGVDINRNFDWEFGGKGSSGDKTDEEYRGAAVFSEPETRVFRDLTEHVQFDGFLSLHSGIQQIYVPYADSSSRQTGREPDNLEGMMKLAKLLSTSTSYTYQYGKAADLNDYSADGTIFDFMAGRRKIPFSYAIELWGPKVHKSASCFDLFNPPNEQLKAVVEDIFPLYLQFVQYIIDWKLPNQSKQSYVHPLQSVDVYAPVLDQQIAHEVPSLSPMYVLLCVLVSCVLLMLLHERYPFCLRLYPRRRIINLRSLSSTLSLNLFRS